MRTKHKNICTTLKYIQHFFVLVSTVTGCILIFFSSLVSVSVAIRYSEMELKTCSINAKIKSIIEKKKHDKTVLLAKTKLHSTKVLISKSLIDSYITRDEFFY